MRERKLKCIPVLDADGKPVDLHIVEQFGVSSALPNHAVLMVGGRGTRLFPMTRDVPKPMLTIGGKPILERIIEDLIDQGIQTFWMSINYLGEAIKTHFDDGKVGELISGIGGGNARNSRQPRILPAENMVPRFCDERRIVANINLERMIASHKSAGASMTVGSKLYNINIPFGVLQVMDGLVTGLKEKPDMEVLVNAGFYMLEPSV